MNSATPSSLRTRFIARCFRLPVHPKLPPRPPLPPLPKPRQIVLIAGPSGSGKSRLLQRLRRSCSPVQWLDLNRLRLPNRPVIDLFDPLPIAGSLQWLSRVGLAEAHAFLLPPAKLSTGQQWRLRLALALAGSAPPASSCPEPPGHRILACDEFTSPLDRLTARIVARTLRKAISAHGHLSAIVATAHDDLLDCLAPDIVIHCDFNQYEFPRG